MTDHSCPACTGDLPAECPQCDTVILGATVEDWERHFREECNPFGILYCFVTEPQEAHA